MTNPKTVFVPAPPSIRPTVVYESELEVQGVWTNGTTIISMMWRHPPSGEVFYEPVPEVLRKGLLVNPFL